MMRPTLSEIQNDKLQVRHHLRMPRNLRNRVAAYTVTLLSSNRGPVDSHRRWHPEEKA